MEGAGAAAPGRRAFRRSHDDGSKKRDPDTRESRGEVKRRAILLSDW